MWIYKTVTLKTSLENILFICVYTFFVLPSCDGKITKQGLDNFYWFSYWVLIITITYSSGFGICRCNNYIKLDPWSNLDQIISQLFHPILTACGPPEEGFAECCFDDEPLFYVITIIDHEVNKDMVRIYYSTIS